jgi:multidrug resistance efflux pump
MKATMLLLSFVAVGSAATFWIAGEFSTIGTAPPQRIVPESDLLPEGIHGLGYIEPVSEVRKLTFKIDGIINACSVQPGDRVKAEAELAKLQNHDETAAVNVAEQELLLARAASEKLVSGVHPSQIEAARARVLELQSHVDFCARNYDRQATLFEKKAGTKEELDEAEGKLQRAREELKGAVAELQHLRTFVRREDRALAEARVKTAEANLAATKARLQNTILAAPTNGTVLDVLKRKGDTVRTFDTTPVIVFADLSQLRIRAEIDERFVDRVFIGQWATIFGQGLGDRRLRGRVVLVKPIMGNKTVFGHDSAERKDLDVIQVFISIDEADLTVGLRVDVVLDCK